MIASDIKFYHSGGSSNFDPLLDLGGGISNFELSGGLDTLFNSLSPMQSVAGRIDVIDHWYDEEQPDYRCFYIKNTHGSETLRNAKFYIDWEKKSGSFIDVGVKLVNEVQLINISGTTPPNENDFATFYLSTYSNFTVDYHVNITEWQGRFQTAIRSVDTFQDVIVNASGYPSNVTFTVYILGQAQSRKFDLISVVTDHMTNQTFSISELTEGSPVNTIACTIPNIVTAPACVDFDNYPLRGNPIELGDLRPGDIVPIWVRRTTPKNTRIHLIDGVRFNVDGTAP